MPAKQRVIASRQLRGDGKPGDAGAGAGGGPPPAYRALTFGRNGRGKLEKEPDGKVKMSEAGGAVRAPAGLDEFSTLQQMCFSPDGTLFIVDAGNNRVHVRDASTHLLVQLIKTNGGISGNEPGQLNRPCGVAACRRKGPKAGVMYLGDRCNNRVCEYRDGKFKKVVDILPEDLANPRGMSLSPCEKYLAVADEGGHCILIIRLDGSEPPRNVGSEGVANGKMRHPFDVAYSPDGKHLIIADQMNCRVQVLNVADGAFVCKFCRDRGDVLAVNVHSVTGNVYVVGGQYQNYSITVWTPTGKLLQEHLGGVRVKSCCAGICIHPPTGRIAVGDSDNNVVHILTEASSKLIPFHGSKASALAPLNAAAIEKAEAKDALDRHAATEENKEPKSTPSLQSSSRRGGGGAGPEVSGKKGDQGKERPTQRKLASLSAKGEKTTNRSRR